MIVYLLLNTVNLKGYVGKHKGNSISGRWKEDLSGGHNSHLENARLKYGSKAFSKEILKFCSSEEEMNNLERLWICTLRTYDPDFGYNKTFGGEGVTATEETKTKISEWNILNAPTRNMMWITNGVKNTMIPNDSAVPCGWRKGKIHQKQKSPGPSTEERKARQSAGQKLRWERLRETNPEFVQDLSKKFTQRNLTLKGKTYEEIYGERAEIEKVNHSKGLTRRSQNRSFPVDGTA